MKKLVLVLAVSICLPATRPHPRTHLTVPSWRRGRQRAEGVTIIRDDWGVPHIYGKTDADVVFGLMYAQAEDDFNRVETNFINSQGRLAEAEGEGEIYRDLRMKLFIDPGGHEGAIRREPAVAEGADGRVGRRVEFLPRHAPRREAARDHEVRTVDGAELQRRQHRRRHRARQPARSSRRSTAMPRRNRSTRYGATGFAGPSRSRSPSRPARTASRSPA